MAGFQLIDDRFADGLFGTSAFGTAAFGGPEWPMWPLPILQVPADDVSSDDRYQVAEIVHRRMDLIVGARKYAVARKWRIVLEAVGPDVKDNLKTFWLARRFNLLQDDDEAGRVVEVYWPAQEFEPQRLRGQYWSFDFVVEEILT